MEAKDVKSLQEAYASMYNTSEESQTEVISETVVRTGPDGRPVFPHNEGCLLYTSPSPRDRTRSRMPSSA